MLATEPRNGPPWLRGFRNPGATSGLAPMMGVRIFLSAWLVLFWQAAFGQVISTYWINTPGARLFIEGSAHYERGNYLTAYSRFHYAALWADKRAQFNLGVMNVSGQVRDMRPDTGLPCAGLGQPMACGWAWLELSAEREYPQFRRVADEVWIQLDERQRRAGRRILENLLLPRYGDEVRMQRTEARMTSMRMRNGMSRVGYSTEGTWSGPSWDFEQIVAYETRLYRALDQTRVELGEFKLVDEEDRNDDSGTRPD